MRRLWKFFRAIVSVLLLLAVILPAAIYVLLLLDPIRAVISNTASRELSTLLGADVTVGSVRLHPFNRATVRDISLVIDGDTTARINTVSAAFDILPLITSGDIILNYALLDGVKLSVWRQTPDAPLNIAPVIARLRSDNPGQENTFSLTISSVVVRRADASYDILSIEPNDSLDFDPAHIAISGLAINADIPHISKGEITVNLDHLSFAETSGFVLDKLSGNFNLTPSQVAVSNLAIALPNSEIAFEPLIINIPDGMTLRQAIATENIAVKSAGIDFYPPDIRAFIPVLKNFDTHIAVDIDAQVSMAQTSISRLDISVGDAIDLSVSGRAENLISVDSLDYNLSRGNLKVYGPASASLLSNILPASGRKTLQKLSDINLSLTASGHGRTGSFDLKSDGTAGTISAIGNFDITGRGVILRSDIAFDDLNLALLSGDSRLGTMTSDMTINGVLGKRDLKATANLNISEITFLNSLYHDISINVNAENTHHIEGTLTIEDSKLPVKAYALYTYTDGHPALTANVVLSRVDLNALGIDKNHDGALLSAKIRLAADNADLKRLSGSADISDFTWTDTSGAGIKFDNMRFVADPENIQPHILIESPILSGSLRGEYDFASLVPQMKEAFYTIMPAFRQHQHQAAKPRHHSNFTFDLSIPPSRDISHFLNTPVELLDTVTVAGRVDTRSGYADAEISAPYILKGNKIIEQTAVFAALDLADNKASLYATTQMPTNKGDMVLATSVDCRDNNIGTHVDWSLLRAIPLNGTLDLTADIHSAHVPAGSRFPLSATVEFLPGTINFGDETWSIEPATIDIEPEIIHVRRFALNTKNQRVAIDGSVSGREEDELKVNLSGVSLLPIFETLEINNALIGGRATGVITASDLLSQAPRLYCPALHVDSIGYNRCTIGDADIIAAWDNDRKAVYLDADITGLEGRKSQIAGHIFPMSESLDINFDADSVPVAFLKPFMEAFTSDITGRASGHCRLFGTFKDIDLEGDIFADDVTLKIDFTNTYYSATDSVHIRPGVIKLDNITIRDSEGHTARLNGEVGHTFFHYPTFRFDITEARDFLSYNVTSAQNPDWYGTIYGNGSAAISGRPGVINIDVNMSTATGSTFTFVLSDRLDAEEYTFLTFRDVTPDWLKPASPVLDDTPDIVRIIRESMAQQIQDSPSAYNMDIVVNITPQATMTLVMDPAGGDEIKATGSGNLHMAYHSANNDLNIWGKYILQSGSYRFTLQDIIIKDFTIKEGSQIQFDGDPYAVKTNLTAYYATNANLTDLDKSFREDKEVARTNVPVHAMMLVTGDIRQPKIDFDLEFPTLTSDTYRKVRSIVSTEDMMNRQIIYLLALNRFYTPDYMSTTKGSELFSVASSTISSQLGNMLGKLSDKWSIAPNLRSDRGDFSDLEVDLALSSRLLNNRLLFNGNFGYRDNALNANQFIGDFDVEYLLTKSGVWRLKAYNRYNDRNYYVRTAQTTQGLGVMYRRDFDSLFSFLRRKKKSTASKSDSTAVTDSIFTSTPDSISPSNTH